MIPLSAGEAVPPDASADIRRRMLLDYCKWDPQVGEVATFAPFPLLINTVAWLQLAGWAESLAAESLAAEQELLSRPDLHGQLGCRLHLSYALCDAGDHSQMPVAARTMRFDFRLDNRRLANFGNQQQRSRRLHGIVGIPSPFIASFSASHSRRESRGRVGRCAGSDRAEFRDIALLSEAGYMEDHQIMAYLAGQLRARNCTPHLCGPRT